jgi:ActR/RegA family two-component response regulator
MAVFQLPFRGADHYLIKPADVAQILTAYENRHGYRRVTAELRLQGIVVNHKRVLRVMREDNLVSLRKRKFVVIFPCLSFGVQ